MENQNLENAKWYVLHTYSGYENVAKENLEQMAINYGLTDRIFDIVIPMEDVIEEKKGKKVLVQRKVMPGYLLVKMIYGDDIWHNVTRTRGITGFTGPKGRPLDLTPEEVQRLRLEKITVEFDLAEGDRVEIIDGPLNTMIGEVVSVAMEKDVSRAKVKVEMFGRETMVDLDYAQLRKIEN
ncbi:MAG: transcription termination/antitermination factor NusG [Clostridia bacterium]|nr:transcription termination/antitermination factor NusG [Clostridia bacterium]